MDTTKPNPKYVFVHQIFIMMISWFLIVSILYNNVIIDGKFTTGSKATTFNYTYHPLRFDCALYYSPAPRLSSRMAEPLSHTLYTSWDLSACTWWPWRRSLSLLYTQCGGGGGDLGAHEGQVLHGTWCGIPQCNAATSSPVSHKITFERSLLLTQAHSPTLPKAK